MIKSYKCVFAIVGLVTIGYLLVKHLAKKVINGITLQGAALRWGSLTTSGISVTVILNYLNDTALPVPLDNLSGSIAFGDIALADVQLTHPVTIQPGAVTPVSVDTSISFVGLSLDLITAIKTKSFGGDGLYLSGDVTSAGIAVPVNYKLVNV